MSDELAQFLTDSEARDAAAEKIEVPRDQWQRPKIVRPGGAPGDHLKRGKWTGYTRASTLGGTLEDTFGLNAWRLRMSAVGIAQRPELILAINAAAKGGVDRQDAKKRLDEITELGMQAAQASAKAHVGTAMHAYAEQIDMGHDPGYIPAEFAPDLRAYTELTQPLFEYLHIEQFCVCDELQVAGTPDRVARLKRAMIAPDGQTIPRGARLITDQKTSQKMDFGGIKFAVQLATYSHSLAYDWQSVTRTPWSPDGDVRTDWGIIVHTPSGSGTASLYWVDLTRGWELAKLAVIVREWRKDKTLVLPAAADCVLADDEDDDDSSRYHLDPDDFVAACEAASSLAELYNLHREAVAVEMWDDVLKQRFSRRKRELEAAAQ